MAKSAPIRALPWCVVERFGFDLGPTSRSDRVVIDGASWEVKLVEADVAGAGHHGAAQIQSGGLMKPYVKAHINIDAPRWVAHMARVSGDKIREMGGHRSIRKTVPVHGV